MRIISFFLQEYNTEISNLKKELNTYQSRHEETQKTLRKSESKVQTLEECIRDMQKNTDGGKISNIMDLTDLKAELLSATKENKIIKERLNGEMVNIFIIRLYSKVDEKFLNTFVGSKKALRRSC